MLAAGVLSGCYTYHPATIEEVQPEARVRARLSPDEVSRLGSIVPIDGRLVEGEVLERGDGEMLLLVPVTSDVVGTRVETLHQRLRIPVSGVIDVELRHLDRLKTGLVVGAGVALAAGVAAAALSGGGRSDRPGTGEPPADLVIPLGFLIRVGR
ncbi:MAG: hypothetical protein ACREIV_11645 [Planctomycetaceae bacterium]